MMFLAKNLGIYSASSLDHMSILPRECPAVLNFSSGQYGAGRVLCGAGGAQGSLFPIPDFQHQLGILMVWHLPIRKQIYDTPLR